MPSGGFRLVGCCLALALPVGCGEPKPPAPPPPGDGDSGLFSVDPYLALVNYTPATVSGQKPAGHGVRVDAAVRVTPSGSTTWSTALALDQGDRVYTFRLESFSPNGQVSTPVDVSITLDTTPPRVTSQLPIADALNVEVGTTVQAQISEPLDCDSVNTGTFALFRGSTMIPAAVTCANEATSATLTLDPTSELLPETRYTATLFTEATDLAGNAVPAAVAWHFDTAPLAVSPPAPTFDAPPPPAGATTDARITVGGTKKAFTSLQVQWTVGGVVKAPWFQLIPKSGDGFWLGTLELDPGLNLLELRSEDLAGRQSAVVSFSLTRTANPAAVAPPTVSPVISPTKTRWQVIRGTKPAGTSIWNGSTPLVRLDNATDWSALVPLLPGANSLSLVAKDASDNASPDAPATIVYDASAGKVAGGSLTIDFTLRDLWDYIGDEFTATALDNTIDHFGVEIWVEGPLTYSGIGPYTYEPCLFDNGTNQRKHARYVATILRTTHRSCLASRPADQCFGWWAEPDYRNPNYLAALIEAGQWASSSYPIPPAADRRDGTSTWASGAPPACNRNLWFDGGTGACRPRAGQPPAVDGLTEASINAGFTNDAAGLGSWSWSPPSPYAWNLKGRDGSYVDKGAYLVSLVVTAHRTVSRAAATDRETCWLEPAHRTLGPHRAEGIVMIDGQSAATYHWDEIGTPDLSTACTEPTTANLITCNCGSRTDFPCPKTPNSATVGTPTKFLLGPVNVTYTP